MIVFTVYLEIRNPNKRLQFPTDAVLLSAAVLYTNGTTTRKGNSDKQN